uniref:BPI fold containing family B member 6 n=1 Tax=Crocodylus porosus TaxID=8502 RepID=A0A7M4EKE2_CROPO
MPELPRFRICCVFFLCGWLVSSHGADAPGAVLRIDIETIDQAVNTAMAESNVLQKLAEAASKKQPGVKPIKGITGLKVKDLQPPEISLMFVPGMGLFMAVLTKITIAGKSFIGGNMEISLVANMTAKNKLSQDDSGSLKFSVENCQIAIVSVKTNLPSSMLPKVVNKFLDSTLQKVMPGLVSLSTCVPRWPLPLVLPFVTPRPLLLSLTRDTGLCLSFQPVLQHQGGDPVDIPADPPALASLPPKTEPGTQIILSANFLAGELTLLQASFDLNITDNPVSNLLLTSAVSELLPPSKPLVIELRVTKPPLVTIKEDKSLLHLFTTMEFLSGDPSDSHDPLFVLETVSGNHLWSIQSSPEGSLGLCRVGQGGTGLSVPTLHPLGSAVKPHRARSGRLRPSLHCRVYGQRSGSPSSCRAALMSDTGSLSSFPGSTSI